MKENAIVIQAKLVVAITIAYSRIAKISSACANWPVAAKWEARRRIVAWENPVRLVMIAIRLAAQRMIMDRLFVSDHRTGFTECIYRIINNHVI